MDRRLQTMLEHFEIRELIEAYVHACDRGDLDSVKACYWEDSYDHHGPISGPGWQFAEACVNSLRDHWTNCTHHIGQSRIRVEGDRAGVETYYFASLSRDQDGTAMIDLQVGRYIDTVVRREGAWRIKDRRCTQEWTISLPQGEAFIDRASFLMGERGPQDLSFAALDLAWGNPRIQRDH